MKIHSRSSEICLGNNQPVTLSQARGLRVTCTAGIVWITVTGEPGDTFLSRGQSHQIGCDGLAIIESIGEGRVRLERPARFAGLRRLAEAAEKLFGQRQRAGISYSGS